ncbi:MAG: hypothetical protein V1712_01675 [Patescibacteria group bacterium]
MDESIFINSNQHHHKPVKPVIPEKLTITAIFLSVILVLTLMVLQIKGLYDINRYFNPHYQVCTQVLSDPEYSAPEYSECNVESYAWQRILLWSYLSGALFLIYLILTLIFRKRQRYTWQRALFYVFTVLTYFAAVVILIYLNYYLFQFYKDIAWYFSLGIIVILSIILVIYIERRRAQKKLIAKSTK